MSVTRPKPLGERLRLDRDIRHAQTGRVADSIGYGRRTWDRRRFADSLCPVGTKIGRNLDQHRLDGRHHLCLRQGVVHQARSQQLTVGVIGHPLVESPANTLRDTTIDLPFDRRGINRESHVLNGNVAANGRFARHLVHLDLREVNRKAGCALRNGGGAPAIDGLVLAADRHAHPGDLLQAHSGGRDALDPDHAFADLQVFHRRLQMLGGNAQNLLTSILRCLLNCGTHRVGDLGAAGAASIRSSVRACRGHLDLVWCHPKRLSRHLGEGRVGAAEIDGAEHQCHLAIRVQAADSSSRLDPARPSTHRDADASALRSGLLPVLPGRVPLESLKALAEPNLRPRIAVGSLVPLSDAVVEPER